MLLEELDQLLLHKFNLNKLVLFIKYLTIYTISPFYIGTDNDIIRIYDQLGFHNYAKTLVNKLANIYTKYGGK